MGESLIGLIEQVPCPQCAGSTMVQEVEMSEDGLFRGADVFVDIYLECQGCGAAWKLCVRRVAQESAGGRGD